jgi:hypothetical protein
VSLKPLKRVDAIKTILQRRPCSGGVTQLKPLKRRCHYSGGATPLKPLEPLNRRYTIEAIEAAYRDGFGLMRWVQWGYVK